MKKDKKEFTRLNKSLFSFLEEVEGGQLHRGTFELVRDQMLSNPTMKSHNFTNVSDTAYDSAYANNIIDENTDEYTTFRASDHLPKEMKTIMTKFHIGRPTDRLYGHMCLLFFGYYEKTQIKDPSKKGNYMPSSDDMSIEISSDKYYDRIKDVYEFYKTRIPYRFYHYVPALLTTNDINVICDACGRWFDNKGQTEFEWPIPKDKNARPLSKPIETEIWFKRNPKFNPNTTNESINVVGNPIASLYLGRINFIDRTKLIDSVDVYMDVMSCEAEAISLVNEWKNLFVETSKEEKKRY